MAKNVKKTEKAVETTTEKTYTEAEFQAAVNEAVNNAVNEAVKKALESADLSRPVVAVAAKEEFVTLLFVGAIARGTMVGLGKLGQITRSGGTLDVPKKDFLANLGLPVVEALLRKRQIIVVDGLTDEERERFGLDYSEGELLSQKIYFKIFDFPKKEICEIFKKLCPEHKKIVAKMYLSKYFDEHDNRVTPEIVKALNKISRDVYADGLFTPIISDMAAKFDDDDKE